MINEIPTRTQSHPLLEVAFANVGCWGGQCKNFVNDVVGDASAGKVYLGGGYFSDYLGAGAVPVHGLRAQPGEPNTDHGDPHLRLDGADRLALAPGEPHKTLSSAEAVWQAMLDAHLTRADHVIALGGGVVGDLAGFCAATYQRGVPIVHVPTTLLAQVDSAYGGKTGVDLPEGKNYVGAYHQPAAVLADPSTLATLPAEELAAGWAEVVKTGLIAGGDLWRRVRSRERTGGRPSVDVATPDVQLNLHIDRDEALTVPALARELPVHLHGLDPERCEADRQLEVGRADGLSALCADLVERSVA